MSTKKEKCCECTSKERPSHVFRSSGTPGMKDGGYFTCNCPCHQTESIEWEKDLSFRFDTWLKLYPGTPTIGEIEEWWLESLRISITTALAKREFEIADEVKKLYSPDYMKGSPSSYINRVLDQVISIIKH